MNQQEALVKLAQVRLAINHVLRTRAMQKQAEGGLSLPDKDARDFQPFKTGPYNSYRPRKYPLDTDVSGGPNSFTGLFNQSLKTPNRTIFDRLNTLPPVAEEIGNSLWGLTNIGKTQDLLNAAYNSGTSYNPGASVSKPFSYSDLRDALMYQLGQLKEPKERKRQEALGKASLTPPTPNFFAPNPPGQKIGPVEDLYPGESHPYGYDKGYYLRFKGK